MPNFQIASKGKQAGSRRGIPNPARVIIRPGGDFLAVGRPGHAGNCVGVARQGEQAGSRRGIPYPGCVVRVPNDDFAAVGRPGHAIHQLMGDDEWIYACGGIRTAGLVVRRQVRRQRGLNRHHVGHRGGGAGEQ